MQQNEFAANAFLFHRLDIYRFIHKGMRLCMSDTLTRVGSTDPDDADACDAMLAQVRELLVLCEGHLDKENTYVHPAMEARKPASSVRIADDHVRHEEDLRALHALVVDVDMSIGAERAENMHTLYRVLGAFVGENLLHMQVEETAHNAVLWEAYSDAELMAIEHAIVESLTPVQKFAIMRWMLPALNAGERAILLGGIRETAPPHVFDAMLAIAREYLAERDFRVLIERLSLQEELMA